MRRRSICAGLLALVIGVAARPFASAGTAIQTGTAVITGRVMSAGDHRALEAVTIQLDPVQPRRPDAAGQRSETSLTTSTGQFVFRDVVPGRYTLTATLSGYLTALYGQSQPAARAEVLVVTAGLRPQVVSIEMWRSAVIAGRVSDELGGAVPAARVEAADRGGTVRSVTTDDRGLYRFHGLPPGDYLVGVPAISSTVPRSSLADGQEADDERALSQLRDRRRSDAPSLGAPTMRIGDFAYYMSAGASPSLMPPQPLPGEQLRVYSTRYYPGVAVSSEARMVSVGSGEEKSGIDISLQLEPTADLTGRVVAVDGRPTPGVGVHLHRNDAASAGAWFAHETANALTDAEGRFTVLGVPAGAYRVHVLLRPSPPRAATATSGFSASVGGVTSVSGGTRLLERPVAPTEPTFWAQANVNARVGEQAQIPDLVLRKAGRVSGRVEFRSAAGASTAAASQAIQVRIVPLDTGVPGPAPARVDSAGRFEIEGCLPSRYRLQVSSPEVSAWALKSVLLAGQDVTRDYFVHSETDTGPLLVTLTDRPARLSGFVERVPASEDQRAVVVLLPANLTRWIDAGMPAWMLLTARSDKTGRYNFASLVPGSYLLAAIDENRADYLRRREFVEAVARHGLPVVVAEGESLERALRIAQVR